MTLLLDTHTFIWFDSDRSQLSAHALALITDPANRVLLSAATVWELVIKYQIGKLVLRDTIPNVVAQHPRGDPPPGGQCVPVGLRRPLGQGIRRPEGR